MPRGLFAIVSIMLCLAIAVPGESHEGDGADGSVVEFADAWARPTPGPVRNGAAYFSITNVTDHDITIVDAASPAAARAGLHRHIRDGNIMRMRPVETVPVPAGETVHFAPGGLHVMLFELVDPLEPGQSFPLVLELDRHDPVTVYITVGAGPAGHPEQ